MQGYRGLGCVDLARQIRFFPPHLAIKGSGFRGIGMRGEAVGCRVSGYRARSSERHGVIWGLRFRVRGLAVGVAGLGCKVWG